MKNLRKYVVLSAISAVLFSCEGESIPVVNDVNLEFTNTFADKAIVLGDANSAAATKHTSQQGQVHHFQELKYVVSNIRLVTSEGKELPYNINDLDKGATVIDQAKPYSLTYTLSNIPASEYKQIKFGLGIKSELNTLDQTRFPKFYEAAGANDTKMHWEWGTGYRFTKIEGFYDVDNKTLSVHTGSTVKGKKDEPESYKQGVDAYRDITLDLPKNVVVGHKSPTIIIKADFDKLLSGDTKITLASEGRDPNATPSIHTANNMKVFVDNLGGDSKENKGMFSIIGVK